MICGEITGFEAFCNV